MLPNVLQPSATDHVPVLAEVVRESLAVQPGETVIDATFGAGGHSALLAADLRGKGKLIAIDRDPSVRPYFERFQRHAGVQARFLRGQFDIVLEQLASNGVRADAVLLDLGVSSMQLDRPERGFSYATDAPLDMRMDPSANRSAADLVNEAVGRELVLAGHRRDFLSAAAPGADEERQDEIGRGQRRLTHQAAEQWVATQPAGADGRETGRRGRGQIRVGCHV